MTSSLRRRLSSLGALALALAGLTSAHAAGPEATLAPSPALECLAPALDMRAKPVYPEEQLERREGATLRARLAFDGPDRPPQVSFDEGALHAMFSGDPPLAPYKRAVEAYAQQLRVPCMKASDEPVVLRQEFVFTPNDGRKVVWTTAVDEADQGRAAQLKCLERPTDAATAISYPSRAQRKGHQGIVMVRVHFDAGAPPAMTVLDDAKDPSFVDAIRPYVNALRMPCLGRGAVDVHMKFVFMFDNAKPERFVLQDVDLPTYVRVAEPASVGRVYFDTRAMQCPFDVRVHFRQPFEPNIVSELETDMPARHALLDWIARLQPRLGHTPAKEVFGQSMLIRVPCTTIDL